MSEKRYFKVEYDEEWYLFDSTTISEQLVKEQAEYGYGVFANSLSPSEVEGLLNEQQSIIEEKDKEIEESKITIQLYETDVSMRDNFLKSKGLYDEFLQCIGTVNE